MASTTSAILYEDVFVVKDVDVGGQPFHNVSRVVGTSETTRVELVIDVQCELYRLKTKEKFTLALAETLDLQGRKGDDSWSPVTQPSLLDKYEYGMYGKIFKVDPAENQRVIIYVSHGGLMMKISGDSSKLGEIKQDQRIYTLLRRIQAQ